MKKFFYEDNKPPIFYAPAFEPFELYYVSTVQDEDSIHPRFLHAHKNLIEIIFILSGKAKYLIDDKKYNLKKGDLVIINNGVLHDETIIPNSGFKSYCMAIKQKTTTNSKSNFLLPKGACPVIATFNNFKKLKELFEMLIDSIQNKTANSNAIVNEFSYNIITLIFNQIIKNKNNQLDNSLIKRKDAVVTTAKTFIDEHFTEDLNLNKIADSVNSSPYYIAHLFKEGIGISPIQYIIRRRIGEAQTLLLTTNQNISYIASCVGYDSIHQFNILFKCKIGLSPTAYRKEYLSITQ